MAAPPQPAEPEPVERHAPESTSTVMFKASDLPWSAPPPPPPPPAPPVPTPASLEPSFMPETERSFEPEGIDAAEVVEEAAVFEEVVEEDLDFEAPSPVPVDEAGSADSGATLMFSGTGTLPPQAPEPAVDTSSATTASFGAVEETTFPETDFEPEPMPELEPEPEPEVATAPPMPFSAFAPEPPPPEPRHFTPPPLPAAKPVEPPPPAPPRFEPKPAESFADLTPHVAEPAPPPPSEAAAVSVPDQARSSPLR